MFLIESKEGLILVNESNDGPKSSFVVYSSKYDFFGYTKVHYAESEDPCLVFLSTPEGLKYTICPRAEEARWFVIPHYGNLKSLDVRGVTISVEGNHIYMHVYYSSGVITLIRHNYGRKAGDMTLVAIQQFSAKSKTISHIHMKRFTVIDENSEVMILSSKGHSIVNKAFRFTNDLEPHANLRHVRQLVDINPTSASNLFYMLDKDDFKKVFIAPKSIYIQDSSPREAIVETFWSNVSKFEYCDGTTYKLDNRGFLAIMPPSGGTFTIGGTNDFVVSERILTTCYSLTTNNLVMARLDNSNQMQLRTLKVV